MSKFASDCEWLGALRPEETPKPEETPNPEPAQVFEIDSGDEDTGGAYVLNY